MYNTRFQRHVPYLVKTQLEIGANAISCCWYPCLFLVFVALQLRCCGQLACFCAYRSGGLPCGQPPVSHCTGCYVYFTYACTFDGLCFCWRRVLCGFFNFSPVQNCFRWLIALAVFWFFMMSPDTSSKIEVFVSRWKIHRIRTIWYGREANDRTKISFAIRHFNRSILRDRAVPNKKSRFSIYCDVYWKS